MAGSASIGPGAASGGIAHGGIAHGRIAHGGNLHAARRRFPHAPAPFIDLSTGINPEAYPFSPLPADAFARLPEPADLQALQAVAARAYGAADPAMVVAAPGTQVLINLLPRLFPQSRVAVLGPTYAEHAAAWTACGAAVHETGELNRLADHPAAVLCNPNNPDGRRVAPSDLLTLAGTARLLVVDEAFADFEGPHLSVVPHLAHPGTIVLRSFGKSFGLAGVRLGFAVALPETAAVIREALGPWCVSGPALRIGMEALGDRPWIDRTVRRLTADTERLDALLRRGGGDVLGGTRLFRLAHAADAPHLADRLGQSGILVRSFADRPGQLRFGIPRHDQWERVGAALAQAAHGQATTTRPAG